MTSVPRSATFILDISSHKAMIKMGLILPKLSSKMIKRSRSLKYTSVAVIDRLTEKN